MAEEIVENTAQFKARISNLLREMASEQPSQGIYFQIIAPYRTDEDAQQRRDAVHGQHVLRLQMLRAASGALKCGGPYMSPESVVSGGEKKAIGSAFVIKVQSYEAAKKLIEDDPYYVYDVWDKAKLMILPFVFFAGAD
ncbi:uncharacterized protein FOMMEDRAFT_157719 [Fomitiporia mediterranea MF3/22]|uniref:uncharacterized protein n=1 Tax=Fomitiporia mediterranea (strain MF3/22) TaxID=694068 RepID=UPI00044088DA|nr:uncharacterized protein FOMMEDRAFT_157719 [Fomitiporia mediterranea MF3/22]EJD02498.1 hypothetical protein FOMMEDRAFT_157719 [Fomitiporia mediterranea MF3/22]